MNSTRAHQGLGEKPPQYPRWSFDDPNPNLVKINIDLPTSSRKAEYEPLRSQFDRHQDLAHRPKHPRWGFEKPTSDLVKIYIDLRTPPRKPGYQPPKSQYDPPPQPLWPSEMTSTNPAQHRVQPRANRTREVFFVADRHEEVGHGYYGGPIIHLLEGRWRPNFYTRASGDVVGLEEFNLSCPPSMSRIVRSTAVITDDAVYQSALWIAPRFVISTLQFSDWMNIFPTERDLEGVRSRRESFPIESEINSQLLTSASPRVELVAFNTANDIGLFKLQDEDAPNPDWVEIDWLMERDELFSAQLQVGQRVGCVAYSNKMYNKDGKAVKREGEKVLTAELQYKWVLMDPLNLDEVAKPGMKTLAPGTLDQIDAREGGIHLGVSSSLWKGSGGGPGVVLEGPHEGRIIGLTRGYDIIKGPYNLLNGFPAGLKEELKKVIGRFA